MKERKYVNNNDVKITMIEDHFGRQAQKPLGRVRRRTLGMNQTSFSKWLHDEVATMLASCICMYYSKPA